MTVKNTSLAFLIGLSELTDIGRQINSRLMTAPMEVYGVLMVLYFVVNKTLSSLFYLLEDKRRFNRLLTWLGLPSSSQPVQHTSIEAMPIPSRAE